MKPNMLSLQTNHPWGGVKRSWNQLCCHYKPTTPGVGSKGHETKYAVITNQPPLGWGQKVMKPNMLSLQTNHPWGGVKRLWNQICCHYKPTTPGVGSKGRESNYALIIQTNHHWSGVTIRASDSSVLISCGFWYSAWCVTNASVRNYICAMMCHQIMLESLERLLLIRFLDKHGDSMVFKNLPDTSKERLSQIPKSPSKKSLECGQNDQFILAA